MRGTCRVVREETHASARQKKSNHVRVQRNAACASAAVTRSRILSTAPLRTACVSSRNSTTAARSGRPERAGRSQPGTSTKAHRRGGQIASSGFCPGVKPWRLFGDRFARRSGAIRDKVESTRGDRFSVACRAAVNRKTVYEYATRGLIPHRRLGRRIVFSRSQVVAWLGQCKAGVVGKGS